MPPYRATDEEVEKELAALERIAQVRLRRYASEMRDIDKDLSELRRERARRRAANLVPGTAEGATTSA